MRKKSLLSVQKGFSLGHITVFLIQHIAAATPSLPLVQQNTPSNGLEINFKLPASTAFISDSYKALNADKTVILIQDAHTNDSGQMNIAKALDIILKSENIDYVFTEAGEGNNSLSYIKDHIDSATRERVANSLLRKGLLQGSEYLSITGDTDFVLWGVENPAAYKEGLRLYKEIAKKRDAALTYLSKVHRTAQSLKSKVYNTQLLKFDQIHQKFTRQNISLTDYFEELQKMARLLNIDVSLYQSLKLFGQLKSMEEQIDFILASKEQVKAIQSLSKENRNAFLEAFNKYHSPFKVQRVNQRPTEAFYLLLEKKIQNQNKQYPELFKYFEYLKEAKKLDAIQAFEELKLVEQNVYATLATTEEESLLIRFSSNINELKDLFQLRVAPDQFVKFTQENIYYDIKVITGFLNRKIMDLDKHHDLALFLESDFDESIAKIDRFYQLTYQRDVTFVQKMIQKMDETNQKRAVLISGGYHNPNLKKLLEEEGISYVSVLPQITSETDHNRYENFFWDRILIPTMPIK